MGLLNQLANSEKKGGKTDLVGDAKQFYADNKRLVSQCVLV